jgi:hypothetical protein
MLKTWPVIFKDFVNYRTIELDKLLYCDREFTRLQEVYSQVCDKLVASLGPVENKLFDDYESAESSMESRKGDLLYQQGIIDGLRLGRLIDRIRQEGHTEFLDLDK